MKMLQLLAGLLLFCGTAVASETGQFGWGIFASGVTLTGDHPWQERYRECIDRYQGHCEIDIPDPYCGVDDCSVIAIEWTVKYLLMQPAYDSAARNYSHNVQCTGASNGRAKCFTRLPINAPFQHRHRRDTGILLPASAMLSTSLSETREAYWENHWFLPYPDPTVFYTYFNEGGEEYGLNYLKHGRNPPGLDGKLAGAFPGIPSGEQLSASVLPSRALNTQVLQPILNSEQINATVQQALEQLDSL